MNLSRPDYELVELKGGYDLLTPTLKLTAGAAREAVNFEVSVNGGYTRIPGYERFDGRPAPSVAAVAQITLAAPPTNLSVGQTITGPSGTAVVVQINGNVLSFTKQTGTFAAAQAITQSALPVGTISALGGMLTSRQIAQATAAAANAYRGDIQAVPGSGPIRGVLAFGGAVYAWRNNAGGTAMVIHRSTAGGWVPVTLGFELAFSAGSSQINEGDTVTGATSGATGVVARVLVRTGDWGTSNAVGTLVLSSRTGTFVAAEQIRVGGTPRATAGGNATQITLAPGGRVQTVLGSFGSFFGKRAYGCDGVNPGFEFDGTTYVPIRTGMAADAPNNVAVHSNHLFFGFNTSLQFSGINQPYRWSPIFGAGEIAMRDVITALMTQPGSEETGALFVFTQNEASVLYGSSSINFKLVPYSVNMGANRYSTQRLDTGYFLDDRGVASLSTSNKFGNFDAATITYNIRPVIQQRRTLITASGINREKSQYRLFFSDGYALYLTIVNGQYMGAMPVEMPNPVTCWGEAERGDGREFSYFGSTNGFVYQLDRGTSFDGAPMRYFFQLNFNPVRSPRLRKRWMRASAEITGQAFAEFAFGYELGYGLPDNEQPMAASYEVRFSPALWDQFTWDNFTWDGKVLAPTELEMLGTAENVALRFGGESDFVGEFTINSVIMHYIIRRGLR